MLRIEVHTKTLRYIYHLCKIFYSFENILVSFCPKNMILDAFWRVIIGVQKRAGPPQLVFLWSSNLKTERPRLQVQSFAVLRLDFKALNSNMATHQNSALQKGQAHIGCCLDWPFEATANQAHHKEKSETMEGGSGHRMPDLYLVT